MVNAQGKEVSRKNSMNVVIKCKTFTAHSNIEKYARKVIFGCEYLMLSNLNTVVTVLELLRARLLSRRSDSSVNSPAANPLDEDGVQARDSPAPIRIGPQTIFSLEKLGQSTAPQNGVTDIVEAQDHPSLEAPLAVSQTAPPASQVRAIAVPHGVTPLPPRLGQPKKLDSSFRLKDLPPVLSLYNRLESDSLASARIVEVAFPNKFTHSFILPLNCF